MTTGLIIFALVFIVSFTAVLILMGRIRVKAPGKQEHPLYSINGKDIFFKCKKCRGTNPSIQMIKGEITKLQCRDCGWEEAKP